MTIKLSLDTYKVLIFDKQSVAEIIDVEKKIPCFTCDKDGKL